MPNLCASAVASRARRAIMTHMPDKRAQPPPPAGHVSRSHHPILGIDPGLRRTGYAVLGFDGGLVQLIEAGVVRLDVNQPLAPRLVQLQDAIDELLESHAPSALACEELYAHYKHPRTAVLMAHARGVILAAAVRRGACIAAVPATHAKKMLTGSGHASKAQIQRAVAATLGLPRLPQPSDVADAIAIAMAGLRMLDAQRAAAHVNGAASRVSRAPR